MTVMDQGSMQVALPGIASHFRADIPAVQWVVVGYALAISVLLLPMGNWGDRLNRKSVYLTGLVLFVAGVLLAGSAASMGMLIGAKILQGAGSAMVQGNMIAILLSVFPPTERGKVLGLNLAVVGMGAVVGPAFGGVLVAAFGWRAVFWASAFMGVVALGANALFLDRERLNPPAGAAKTRYDLVGAGVSGAALLSFLLVAINGYKVGWASLPILGGMLASMALLGFFIWWELRVSAPMLDVRVFRNRLVLFGVAAGWANFMSSGAVIFLMPFYLQKIAGYSAREAGLILVPGALALALAGAVSGPLSDRFDSRVFTVGGLALAAIALLVLALGIRVDTPLVLIIPLLMLATIGNGLFNSPNNSAILNAVDRSRYGVVSALTQLTRNASNVVSIAIASTVVTSTMSSHGYPPSLDAVTQVGGESVALAFVDGFQKALAVLGVLVAGGIVFSVAKPKQAPHPAARPTNVTALGKEQR